MNDHKDSCYNASTDEEIKFPPPDAFAGGDEDEREEAESITHHEEPGENAGSQATRNKTNANDHGSDSDSVDLVLRDDYDPYGKIAYCCQNCR